MEIHLKTYGARQKYLREQAGMQQKELLAALVASGADVAPNTSYMSELERTSKTPGGTIVAATADIFNTTADFLLGRTENPDPIVERRANSYMSPDADEASRLIDNMSKPHRDTVMSMIRNLAELSRQQKATSQYKDVAGVMLAELEREGGEELLSKTLSMLESRLPGSSAVALRLRREHGLQDVSNS